jgi:hypothetical protein
MLATLRLETGSQPASQTERPFPGGPVVKPLDSVVRSIVFVSVVFFVANVAFAQNNVCSATARGALRSCQAGAQSDNLLALAKCSNESDATGRNACRKQAQADLKDALDVCSEQLSTRQQIWQFLGRKGWDPEINPANFSTNIDNPYMPLKPGKTYVYQAHTADGLITNLVTVTHKTKLILDVTCVEVHDTVFLNGQKTEDTLDWYAQDGDGNVWYFGEDSEDITDGRVSSLAGSWTAGVDGAEPGIIMEAHPKVGDTYRQELLLNEAEDFARVLSLDENVKVPFGSFDHCLKTTEGSGVEPGAVEFKFYAPGVGVVFDNDVSGEEKDVLVKVITE